MARAKGSAGEGEPAAEDGVGTGATAGLGEPEGGHETGLAELAGRATTEREALDRELAEIDMLIVQARSEATRHEARRAQAVERLAAAKDDAKEAAEAAAQLASVTKRAAAMESQVEVLEGKKAALGRFRDAMAAYADVLGPMAGAGGDGAPGARDKLSEDAEGTMSEADASGLPPAVSRVVLGAQEDLRREIARAMHDGPAQSLTNIVLQAQIVDRLLERDPALARRELGLLVGMVQQTLEATKSFIFEVRPMVLDDLGLVPTLRRTARERGRRTGLAVGFDSVGADRRLGVDVESALFRIVDEALAAYLERAPDSVSIGLDWNDRLRIEVAASRASTAEAAEDAAAPAPAADVPPALAAMIEDRRAKARAAAPGPIRLPDTTWREIRGRARTVGASAELLDDGGRLVVEAALPEEAG